MVMLNEKQKGIVILKTRKKTVWILDENCQLVSLA